MKKDKGQGCEKIIFFQIVLLVLVPFRHNRPGPRIHKSKRPSLALAAHCSQAQGIVASLL
jgi:hypothetical protein